MKEHSNLVCKFYVAKKRRFCNLTPKKDEEYCGEHLTTGKVACPLNGNHYIKEEELQYHIQYKCDKRLIITEYYSKDFNTILGDNLKVPESATAVYQNPLLLEKIQSIPFDKSYEESVLEHPSMIDRVLDCRIGKHARQQSSLLANLDKLGLLNDNLNYHEFGCGSAEFTKFLSLAVNPFKMFLIDRKKHKLKIDYDFKLRNYERVLIDIRDLDLSKVDQSLERPAVVYSKHLCGVATDLTLRCLYNFIQAGGKVRGIVIALCCHAVCSYNDYINPEYLQNLGIGIEEFELLKRLSAWAVSGVSNGNVEKPHWSNLTYEQREELGYKCKRILDEGRVQYCLEKLSASRCDLKYYVSRQYSKENMILIAEFSDTLLCNEVV